MQNGKRREEKEEVAEEMREGKGNGIEKGKLRCLKKKRKRKENTNEEVIDEL